MKLSIRVPYDRTISYHQPKLEVDIPSSILHGSQYIVINSTSLKIFGKGERKVRMYGYNKRRTYQKLH